ncbi:MAP kinase [Aureobasidium pullulans]|nr:MAP kinase [Aureobasidium pullulans]
MDSTAPAPAPASALPLISPIMEEGNDERPDLVRAMDSSGTDVTDVSEDYETETENDLTGPDDADVQRVQFQPAHSIADGQMTPASQFGWSVSSHSRTRNGSGGGGSNPANINTALSPDAAYPAPPQLMSTHPIPPQQARPARPPNVRQPSNAYAPARRPHQYSYNNTAQRARTTSTNRVRRNPNAEYRAQEKAYVQRLRQDAPPDDFFVGEPRTPSLDHSDGSEPDDESPATGDLIEHEHDEETLLYYGNEDMQPSIEELKIPENRERLEWHSMLANVLTGDVVKQEKKRLIGGQDPQSDRSMIMEIWTGVRAKVCGRSLAAQRRMIEDGRSRIKAVIEEIIGFEIKGEAEAGKIPLEQVRDVVQKIEKIEGLYPTRQSFIQANPRAASDAYINSCDAVMSWHNTTDLINTQLGILQAWVGNQELSFDRPRQRGAQDTHGHIIDESTFIDRILKEDGLRSLWDEEKENKENKSNGLFHVVNTVIDKAKSTLISNAESFADRHLPPYIEELLTLINFPSRLVQEIIKVRIGYAKKMKDPAQQGVMMAEQMILQFQSLLKLAVKVKEAYLLAAHPEPGWDLPPCIDENFDRIVLEAVRFYFRMLNWKLMANKNTFKEAEILEQEWGFCNELGRHLEGGDVEVAEQFSSLTSKSLSRLTLHFERELQKRPDEVAGAEMDKRYKNILDSVRVRQRKIFRFSRLLSQRFENATEYSLNMNSVHMQDLIDALIGSGHFLIDTDSEKSGLYFIACPTLDGRLKEIETLLRTCYHPEESIEDLTNPYVLILKPECAISWDGAVLEKSGFSPPHIDLRTGFMRLIADGPQERLGDANTAFASNIGIDLNVVVPQRANMTRVNQELQKIRRTTYKLSNTIMDSVEIVRKQTEGLECQELIQTCFAFATEFGQRSVLYMDPNRRAYHNLKMTRLALDWVSFVADDCIPSDRKTFRWAVVALEFAMVMTRGQNILSISMTEYDKLRAKVAGCMSLLISHFDIMGARSNVAAEAEKQRLESMAGKLRLDVSKLRDDEESSKLVQAQWVEQLQQIDEFRKEREAERQALGRVLEDSNEADRALTYLSASAGNVVLRWQQGQFVGGGTFGSVYAAINLDSGHLMAVKEIRLQDPQLIPTIVSQIRDEMGVLQVLDHPNVVSYYGIEPHRDKVYIFMEYCSGGSLAGLLEHGRIEDETVIQVYGLQMLEGLAYLHEAGVVHRDIKPENILLDHNGVIKYVDFGAAKVIAKQGKTLVADPTGRGGRQNSMTGTPMYMSPEVIKGGAPVNSRHGAVDIWSLGCVILEMATGRRPWASLDNEWAIMYNIAQGNPPQQPSNDQLSELGLDFLQKCFERDPARRSSAAELLQHEWIMQLRNQLSLEPGTPATPASEASFGSMSRHESSNGSYGQ